MQPLKCICEGRNSMCRICRGRGFYFSDSPTYPPSKPKDRATGPPEAERAQLNRERLAAAIALKRAASLERTKSEPTPKLKRSCPACGSQNLAVSAFDGKPTQCLDCLESLPRSPICPKCGSLRLELHPSLTGKPPLLCLDCHTRRSSEPEY